MKGYYKMTQDRKTPPNAPSTTGNPSGSGRSNAPPRHPGSEPKEHSVRPIKPAPPPNPKKG